MKTLKEISWNILDWDRDADLGPENIRENMRKEFVEKMNALPIAWIVRPDQANKLLQDYKPMQPDANGFQVIETPFGYFSLIIVHNRLKEGL